MRRPFISVCLVVWLVLHASLATAQKADFFDSLINFHSALFGRYGDEGPLAASALDRLAASVDTLAQSPVAELIPDSASRTPVFAPAHYAEGFALLNSHRFGEAMDQFRTALGTDPLLTDPARLNPDVRAGAAAMRENRTAAAIQHFEASVAALAESSEAHRLLGLAYRAGARPQDAFRHLRDAVRLAPHDERAGIALGTLLTEAGNLSDAEQVLRQTIEAVPTSGVARWALALVYDLQNRGVDAISTLEEVVALPIVAGKAAIHWRVAQLANRHQQYEQVIAALAQRARLLPNEPVAHKDLGLAFLRIGRDDEALTELLMALSLGGADAATLSAIGRIHLAAERLDDAERILRRAVVLNPADAQARYALGNTLIRMGKTAEGMQHLKEFDRLRSSAHDDLRRQFEDPSPSTRQKSQVPTDK